MRKKYIYENATVYITVPDDSIKNIYKATEKFLYKVIKERDQNGNINQSRTIRKK